MAASMLASNLGSTSSSSRHIHELDFNGSLGLSKLSRLGRSGLISSALPSLKRHVSLKRRSVSASASAGGANYDHIPKQFREENLKEGLKENFKNVPKYFYGLSPSQMDMFMTEDSPIMRQSQKATEESISSARNYLDNGGMWSQSGMKDEVSKYSMSVSMYSGGARGFARPRSAPPDLPSLLLDARICFLGMPIVPAVTELLVAQFMWLDYDNPSKPIYLYINSPGTQNEKMETVGSETEAYAIADTIAAKELDANTDYYIELLSKGIGKPKEEIAKDIQRPKYFQAQEAIAYGIADKIIDSRDAAFEKRNYDEMLAQSRAMRRGAGAGPQAAPSGFR
ncbi:hypothetical protein QJS10_CPA02g00300 [Acorus calamus]|uniref:ATP-dependent Clp protease proteolytic subunit n=1 Tax=Acorus calamus TaxID=4465 RepID=A0AAV9FFR8_ACOCL|nr:hypothetical protein QJS10_CPA02g00300 [Acorus calamus]